MVHFFFLLFIVSPLFLCAETIHLPSAESDLQFKLNVFMEENSCGQSRASEHKTFILKLDLPWEMTKKKLTFKVTEDHSSFVQMIDYDSKVLSYRGRDYTLPACNSPELCNFEIHILPWSHHFKKDLHFKVEIYEPGREDVPLLEKRFLQAKNRYLDAHDTIDLRPKLELSFDQKKNTASAKIPVSWAKNILHLSRQFSVIFSWRESKDQIQPFNKETLVKQIGPFLQFSEKIIKPTYLALKAIFLKNNVTYEIKLLIHDVNNRYFDCNDKSAKTGKQSH
jgi:hypothetical protein